MDRRKIIYQDDAIDALCKSECGCNNAECRHRDNTDFCVTCDSVNIIKSLPSVQPERKTGRWIKTARWGRVYYCNQCRNYLDFDGVNAGRGSTNFCPNCGADMRGEKK